MSGFEQDIRIRQQQGASKLPVAFATGWGSYGSGYEAVTYSKHGRVVRLQGMATKTGGAPAAGNVIFTLPVNFRPTGRLRFVVVTGNTDTFGVVTVETTGDVLWQAGSVAETDYTSLSGVSFVV